MLSRSYNSTSVWDRSQLHYKERHHRTAMKIKRPAANVLKGSGSKDWTRVTQLITPQHSAHSQAYHGFHTKTCPAETHSQFLQRALIGWRLQHETILASMCYVCFLAYLTMLYQLYSSRRRTYIVHWTLSPYCQILCPMTARNTGETFVKMTGIENPRLSLTYGQRVACECAPLT
jgi:hypothetical protein